MKRMIVNKIFRAFYWGEFSFIDGEFEPDIFKTKDFKVFTEAVKFLEPLEFGGQIREVLIYNAYPKEEYGSFWEYDIDGIVLIQG